MSIAKLFDYSRIVWSHKKKILFFGGLSAWGASYVNTLNNEQILRSDYARQAERIGAMTIGSPANGAANYRPLKLHVFIDRSDSMYHKNLASFNKNVLPLLQLAGFDVLMQTADSLDELKSFGSAADVRHCAGVAVIGSRRDAVPPVLSGLFVGSTNATMGNEARTSLAVFDPVDRDDVDGRCRKAMRIIKGQRQTQHVYTTRVYFKDTAEEVGAKESSKSDTLRTADLAFGWFDFCHEWERKFWWLGLLSEMLFLQQHYFEHYPQPMPIVANITQHCSGCRRCVTEAVKDPNEENQASRWWQRFVGRREQPGDQRRRQFATVTNPDCGTMKELKLDVVNVAISNLNEGIYGGLRLNTIDSFASRWQAVWCIWTRWKDVKSSEDFYVHQAQAQTIELQLQKPLPLQVRQTQSVKRIDEIALSEDTRQLTRLVVKTLPNVIQIY